MDLIGLIYVPCHRNGNTNSRIILALQSAASPMTSTPRSCLLIEGSREEHGNSRAVFFLPKLWPYESQDDGSRISCVSYGQGDIWKVCLNWHTPGLCPTQISSCEWILWSRGKRLPGLAFDNSQVKRFPLALTLTFCPLGTELGVPPLLSPL